MSYMSGVDNKLCRSFCRIFAVHGAAAPLTACARGYGC
jgi:hypothetical protein